jgi:outer membrane protein TolC
MREELEQLQLELVTVLGMPTIASLDPQIGVRDVRQALNEADLYLEALASNLPLRQAQVKVERARDALALERKTRGWDVKASGGLQVNEVTSGLTWNVGLMASKTLYPRNTVIEELELSLAKAEHELSVQENALEGEVRRALQSVTAAENQVELLAEHLAEAREDLDFRHRQYEAGLVTELQVQDTALTLQKAEYDYAVAQMHYAQSILNLWNLCGRDLSQGVFELID